MVAFGCSNFGSSSFTSLSSNLLALTLDSFIPKLKKIPFDLGMFTT